MKKAIVAASCAAVITFAAPVNAGGFSEPMVDATQIVAPEAMEKMAGGMSSGSTAIVAGIAVLLLAAGLSSSSGT